LLIFFLQVLFIKGKMGIQCPKCQHENSDDTLYCGKCAGPLKSAEEISYTKTLITPTESLPRGTTFAGRYQLIDELGRGGMGVVYKAEDTKLKRTVALKFLPPELTHIPDVKERFIREAQTAAGLDHPNICTVYEFDEDKEKSFISMAYIDGQSLRKKIESGPLEIEEAVRIATQVAEGLKEAHKKGIIHRDIKSSNIMLDKREEAKIMDFGLARKSGGTLITKDGTTMGTIAYMSPEQARGEDVDDRTDIWSFGVVLYEMFTGQLPFKGEFDQGVVHSILNTKPKPVRELRSEIPASIGQVVDKALEKNPDERYQQIDELLDDLKSISAGIVPEEIKARLRKVKLHRRKRVILYAGATGLIISMAMIALSLLPGRAEAIESIAVLPLKNQTGDAELEYFVDGATDELIGQLAKIGAWNVISRTSVMQYKGVDKPLPEIARELNVDAVVEGTVYQVGESVRIRVQLFDVFPVEQSLWADTYDRAKTDVLVMYSEMARTIADKTQVDLTAEEITRLTSANQVNPEVYDAYLKGQFHWYKLTPPELKIAQHYFDLALQLDPDNALAHAGIALVWHGLYQMNIVSRNEAVPLAKAAAEKALELDSTLAEAHYVLAVVGTWAEWNWEKAEIEFLQALRLKPNYSEAHAYYSHYLAHMGRTDEALQNMERALELDPIKNALFHGLYGVVLIYNRRYEDALAAARSAFEIDPGHPIGRFALSQAYIAMRMHDEQLAFQRQTYAPELVEALERGLEEGGYEDAQRAIADVWGSWYGKPGRRVNAVNIARLYIEAGDNDMAIEWFEKAYKDHLPNMPYLGLPNHDPLRSDPHFQDLLRRIGLPVGK
jgi:TolB-like protein/Tfp pilus assembly protein PilF/predicted Ser/Thr protein kinase